MVFSYNDNKVICNEATPSLTLSFVDFLQLYSPKTTTISNRSEIVGLPDTWGLLNTILMRI